MVPGASRTIILAGTVGADEVSELADHCRRLHVAGLRELHLDIGGVSDCDRAGLAGLTALTSGSSGLTVRIEGAGWGQFMLMLSVEPTADIQGLCDSVRALVGAEPATTRGRHSRHGPARSDPAVGGQRREPRHREETPRHGKGDRE